MNLSIRSRLFLLSLAPIVVAVILIMFFVNSETETLTEHQTSNAAEQMMEMSKEELSSYLAIAETSLTDLRGNADNREEVIRRLRQIEFGSSGYIFGYDSAGVRWLLGKNTAGIGESFINAKDKKGNDFIRNIINSAKQGDGFATYYFPKPGESEAQAKLSYSTYLAEWDLIIGTGFYTDDIDETVLEMQEIAENELSDSLRMLLLICVVTVSVVAFLAVLVTRTITAPLNDLDRSLSAFSSGDADLTARLDAFSIPELSSLSNNFNAFVASLHDIIVSVNQVSKDVFNETELMNARTGDVNELVGKQSEETEQVASAMTEMTTSSTEISNNATQAAQSAQEADNNANQALEIVNTAVSSVVSLSDEVVSASEVISRLEGDVSNISSALTVIQDIAEQTNLLALNAAIEAARAGDQGRGFAVVADEVRKLASRTQESTLEIHTQIEHLKAASDNAVAAMDSSTALSRSTVDTANEAKGALENIMGAIHIITDMNDLIATATEEQTLVGADISQRIVLISDHSQHAATLANENQGGSQSLNAKANELHDLVSRFKV